MKIKAYAKVNLFLDIIGKRDDGYHNIETIFQEIDLFDELDINLTDNNFKLTCNIKELENDDNILKKAYNELSPYLKNKVGVIVNLHKNIPFGGGLGGGSSDCANFINTMLTITDTIISEDKLNSIGSKLGADVPFFFKGGCAIGKGIGDNLEKINTNTILNILLINPNIHISTKEAYLNCKIGTGNNRLNELKNGLVTGNIEKICSNLYNSFEETVFKKYPEIKELKTKIIKSGAIGSLMSGSGSTCFGIFENEEKAKIAEEIFLKNKNYFTKLVKTIIR